MSDQPAPARTAIVFGTLVMDPADHTKNLCLHSGMHNLYGGSHDYAKHLGSGGLIQIEDVQNSSDSTAADFAVAIRIPQKTNDQAINAYASDLFSQLQREVLKHNLQDKLIILDVAVFEGADDPPAPTRLWVGFIDSVNISEDSITLLCYTASHRLDETTYSPTALTDFQHKNWVDKDDNFCLFATTEISDSGVSYP